MATRLNEISDSSSDEETSTSHGLCFKRKASFEFDENSKEPSKMPCLDSSYDYYEEKKNDQNFGNPNFYETNSVEKSEDELEDKSQGSFYVKDSAADSKKLDTSIPNMCKVNKQSKSADTGKTKSNKPNKGEHMLKSMGYVPGKGLGKNLQGKTEPVAASNQKGRRGLGFELKELEEAKIEFDPNEEIIEAKESISWLENKHSFLPAELEVKAWEKNRKLGLRNETIDGETNFCHEIVVKNIVKSKSIFNRLDKNEMYDARTRSNPFETIHSSIFLNRAAVKMANIDKVCDFMFTKNANIQPNELLYFADVCAGPGGFSEYVFWRKQWRAKGFGMTLKHMNDFKLDDFHAGPCETFHPYYGPKENGDVYDPDNQKGLKNVVMKQTNNQGVHFMMSDGGFSVEGQENIQEILSKQLYLCQCLVALMIVRTGGHFITKMFDLFTPFSAGLVYIMYRCFDSISIFKPNTSRPANSERYLICRNKKQDVGYIADYLFNANKKLLKGDLSNDLLELVPIEELLSDKEFYNYLKNSNDKIGHLQIVGLKKIAAYVENKGLYEPKQKLMRDECLQYWELPDEARNIQCQQVVSTRVQQLLPDVSNVLDKCSYKNANVLSKSNIENIFSLTVSNWVCMPCSSGEYVTGTIEDKTPTFYFGMGRCRVYRYRDRQWEQLKDVRVELPRDTLIFAEMVIEFRKEKQSQLKTYGLNILDAYTLGTEKINQKSFEDRIQQIHLFCESLYKPTDPSFTPLRRKEIFEISPSLGDKLKTELKTLKNNKEVPGYHPERQSYETDEEPYFYILRNVILFKKVDKPWMCGYSSKLNKTYYFQTLTKKSVWEFPKDGIVDFIKCVQNRVIWHWSSDSTLNMKEFLNYYAVIKQKSLNKSL